MSSSTTSADRVPALARNARARWLLPIFLVVLAAFSWQRLVRSSAPREATLAGEVMGSTWSVRLTGVPAEDEEALQAAIQAALDGVDGAMSTYKEDSELSRFNRHASLAPFPLSPGTDEVFRIAAAVSERSGGAFDVTIAPLVALWGFGAGARVPGAPPEAELEEARQHVGWQKLVRVPEGAAIQKQDPALVADLSAVAKGYGVDQVAALLSRRGQTDYLVDVGGELRARGERPEGGPWRAGIERPDAAGRTAMEVVLLTDEALATSGDYRNYYEEDGVRRSHLLDPRTGHPIEHGLASVSVIHPEAAWADAWATALSILGPSEGWEVAEREGLAVHFIVREADGSFSSRSTPSFAKRLRSEP